MASRGGRRAITLSVVLMLVLGGLFAADRIGLHLSEQALSRQARADLARYQIVTPYDPVVAITGFPFLTQVVAGEFHRVTISARDLSGGGLQLSALNLVGIGVHASPSATLGGDGAITADHLTGTATISWTEVSTLISQSGVISGPVGVRALDDSHVQLTVSLRTDLGTYRVDLTAGVAVIDGQPTVDVRDAAVEGTSVPAPVLALLTSYIHLGSYALTVPPLPYRLRLTGVRADPAGVVLSATAQGVPIATGR